MNIRHAVVTAVLGVAVAGCVPTTPRLDARFGESVAIMRAQQTRDPDASSRNADRPVDGIEARAARETMDRYYKSFADPEKPTGSLIINVGTGESATGR
jgi:hypothetical protein